MRQTVSRLEQGWLELASGRRLHTVERPAASGAPTVIFLHGFTDSWRSFERLWTYLEPGLRLFTFDARGHGTSGEAETYTLEGFAADLHEVVATVSGHDKVALVGHSLGSFVAQRYAIDHPERVGRLVLLGTGPQAQGKPELEALLAEVQTLPDPVPRAFVQTFQESTLHRPIAPEELDRYVEESAKLRSRTWQGALSGLLKADHRHELSAVQAPTLVLWGERDDLFSRAEQETLTAALPHATLRTYAEVGHGLHWEVPETVAADLNAFLRDTASLADFEEQALEALTRFPLTDALFGRRSRRFFLGAEVPDGPLAFRSRHPPLPLSKLERLVVLSAVSGKTGWHNNVTRHERYQPHLSNYPASPVGRTFPSAAGFHTSQLFFTDDSGTYFFDTRDGAPPLERGPGGTHPLRDLVLAHEPYVRRLSDARLHLPPYEPYMEGHNSWVANRPGSLLVIPVGDVAQHTLLNLLFFAVNGFGIFDDVNGRAIPGLDAYGDLIATDAGSLYPLTFVEQYSLTEVTAELATSAYAGALMLQGLGLGGWAFNGIDRLSVLGASGDPAVPGLGFRYDTDARWPLPNPTGLPGVFESFTPPHYADLRAAVDALAERKFGPGGPYHPDTPGPWKDSARVRGTAKPYDDRLRELVALQAQYLYDTFGKFPGTVPSVFVSLYLQAHHLDLEYYDTLFKPGAYLDTHARHLHTWHAPNRDDGAT